MTYRDYMESQKKFSNNGWYLRFDNNGWRPVFSFIFKRLFLN